MTKNWEQEKDRMHELYMRRGMKLADVSRIMNSDFGFQASERAYKQKFKEWQWFKKAPRSSSIPTSSREQDDPMPSSASHSPSGSDHAPPIYPSPPRHQHQMAANYEHFALPFEAEPYPVPNTADMTMAGGFAHSSPAHHMSQQYGGRHLPPQHSLPSFSAVQVATFRDNLAEATRRGEMGQWEEAEKAVGNAMRSLHWLKRGGA